MLGCGDFLGYSFSDIYFVSLLSQQRVTRSLHREARVKARDQSRAGLLPTGTAHPLPHQGGGTAREDSGLQWSDACTPSDLATHGPGRDVQVAEHEDGRLRTANPVPRRTRHSPRGCQGARGAAAAAGEPHPPLRALVTGQLQ